MALPAPSHRGLRPTALPGAVLLAILLGTALRLLLAAVIPLGNDEAYYVDWARNLSPGYLDHPPAVAFLMALPLRLLGAHPLSVRFPAVLLEAFTLAMAASLVRSRKGDRAALATALALQAAPVFCLGAALITPDAPLCFAWVGTLWALGLSLDEDPRFALLCGAFLGLGALSKLTAGLLGVALFAALLVTPDGRRILKTPWPWLGVLLAAALASPMLLWNAAHGWPTFLFQASHGMRGRSFSAARLFASLGAQLGYVSPILLALSAAAGLEAMRRRPDALVTALAFSSLPVAAFFTVSAAFTPGALPHWPAPGWLSAVLLLCLFAGDSFRRPFRLALGVGFSEVALGLLVLLLLLAVPVPAAIPLPGGPLRVARGPLDDLIGWREGASAARAVAGPARLAAAHRSSWARSDGTTSGRWPTSASGGPAPASTNPDPRSKGERLLLVTVDDLGPQRDELEARLGPLEPAGGTEARQGDRLVRSFHFYWVRPLGPLPP